VESLCLKKFHSGSEEKNILRTLMLQLEQSKRERRILEIELSLQKKGNIDFGGSNSYKVFYRIKIM